MYPTSRSRMGLSAPLMHARLSRLRPGLADLTLDRDAISQYDGADLGILHNLSANVRLNQLGVRLLIPAGRTGDASHVRTAFVCAPDRAVALAATARASSKAGFRSTPGGASCTGLRGVAADSRVGRHGSPGPGEGPRRSVLPRTIASCQ